MTLAYDDPAMAAAGKAGDGTDVIEAEFGELVPDERMEWLVQFEAAAEDLAGVMRMAWLLPGQGSGTEVTFVASEVPPGIGKEDHATRMRSSLDDLPVFLRR